MPRRPQAPLALFQAGLAGSLKRHAGRPHDDTHRVLVECAFISGDDGIEACIVVFIAGHHDLDVLRRLMHDPAAVAVAPLSDGVDDGQAVGKARYQFARDEKLPFGFRDAAAVAFAFAELKLVVEPGGAVALAALMTGKIDVRNKVAVAVLSGGNVDPDLFSRLVA